jgi:serine/threonine protein kinase
VFRATSAATGREVALKRLHRQLARTPEALTRLRRELEALGRLHHRAIVPVIDVIRWQGDPTIVMDYVPGRDLKEVLQTNGPLSFEDAEQIMRELLDALNLAHGAGIVHRDVKPQNVRIGEDGRVFLLDFGSARLDASSQLTTTGTTIGTPDYMAPELFAGPVYDPRADLYGCGATIFEALTGRAPQVTQSLTELAWRRTNEDAPPVVSLRYGTPLHLSQVVDRCLARAPDHRYATASQALWALDHPQEERRFVARRSSLPPCLHCGAAIPPEANVCSGCGSDHPFCYKPGHTSVSLAAINDPAKLASELCANFPELEVSEISQRFAAVGAAPQRIVSMIDKSEAIALSDRLREAGADCRVEEDPGISGSNTKAPFWGAIIFMLSSIAAFAVGLPLELATFFVFASLIPAISAMLAERLYTVDRASQGLLSRGRASTLPAARFALTAAAPALAVAGWVLPPLARTLHVLGIGGALALVDFAPALFVGAAVTGATAIAARSIRFERARKAPCGSAEPHFFDKIWHAFSLPSRAIAPMKQQVAGALAVAVLALIPLELMGAAVVRSVMPSFWTLWRETAIHLSSPEPVYRIDTSFEPELAPEPELELPPELDLPLTDQIIVQPLPLSLPSTEALLPSWLDARTGSLMGGILAADLLLLALLAMRRRRFRREGRALEEEIELNLTPKLLPISRSPHHSLSAADRIAERTSDDAFVESTKRLAAELAHHLDREEIDRLAETLDQAEARAERSFLARCILETDTDLALRFELLRLTGKMEAKAAERWAATIPGDDH